MQAANSCKRWNLRRIVLVGLALQTVIFVTITIVDQGSTLGRLLQEHSARSILYLFAQFCFIPMLFCFSGWLRNLVADDRRDDG